MTITTRSTIRMGVIVVAFMIAYHILTSNWIGHNGYGAYTLHQGQNVRRANNEDKPSLVLNIIEEADMGEPVNTKCMKTRTKSSVMICLHTPLDEVSSRTLREGQWEGDTTAVLYKMMNMYPNSSFIDLGSNIGYYTHQVAAMGRKVVAVDALRRNVPLLLWGAKLNGRRDQITMVLNALSDTHTEVELSTPTDPHLKDSWLMTFVGGEIKNVREFKKIVRSGTVKTITLDDLTSVVTTPVAVMKIDIEGNECKAMRVSSKLFAQVFIPYIVMEWRFNVHQTRKLPNACTPSEVVTMAKYLNSLGYQPYYYHKNRLTLWREIGKDTRDNAVWVHRKAKDFLSATDI